jgi:hypothetical protein
LSLGAYQKGKRLAETTGFGGDILLKLLLGHNVLVSTRSEEFKVEVLRHKDEIFRKSI